MIYFTLLDSDSHWGGVKVQLGGGKAEEVIERIASFNADY